MIDKTQFDSWELEVVTALMKPTDYIKLSFSLVTPAETTDNPGELQHIESMRKCSAIESDIELSDDDATDSDAYDASSEGGNCLISSSSSEDSETEEETESSYVSEAEHYYMIPEIEYYCPAYPDITPEGEDTLEGSFIQRKLYINPLAEESICPTSVHSRLSPSRELADSWFKDLKESHLWTPAQPLANRVALHNFPRIHVIHSWNREYDAVLEKCTVTPLPGPYINRSLPAMAMQDHPLNVVYICQTAFIGDEAKSVAAAKTGRRTDAVVLYLQTPEEIGLDWSAVPFYVKEYLIDLCMRGASITLSRCSFEGKLAYLEAKGPLAEALMDTIFKRLNHFQLPNNLHIRVKYGIFRNKKGRS